LTHEQTRYIYETNTIGADSGTINVDDIVETANHFKCIDMVVEQANQPLSETFIKQLHLTLKNGTSDSRKDWFAVGEYKKLPNEVGGHSTVAPEEVSASIKDLLRSYNTQKQKTLEGIIKFHYEFEAIHPFQDGNGRVGRLILFKECLRNNIVPLIIDEELKMFYYRGLHEWKSERGFLRDTCLAAQDKFKKYLDYFRIPYEK
jgi:Fic family protein